MEYLFYQNISSWIYTNRTQAISFIVPINWTKASFCWHKINICGAITVKNTYILYTLLKLEFASIFFAALIPSAPSNFKISSEYYIDIEIFLHLFAVSVTVFEMKKP